MPANYQELLQAAFNRFDPAGLMNIAGIPQHEYRGELKSFLQQKARATDEVKTADLLYDIFDKAFNTGTDMKGNKIRFQKSMLPSREGFTEFGKEVFLILTMG